MKKKTLSLIIPAHNEEACIENTVRKFHLALKKNAIKHEILVINDNSQDSTEEKLISLSKEIKELRYLNNYPPHGFGLAVRKGLENFRGDYVAIVMADLSDRPIDLVKYFRKAEEGFDCVFGSRFIRGAKVIDYPIQKLILNPLTNNFFIFLFFI